MADRPENAPTNTVVLKRCGGVAGILLVMLGLVGIIVFSVGPLFVFPEKAHAELVNFDWSPYQVGRAVGHLLLGPGALFAGLGLLRWAMK
jgi:hypothetical protein